MAFESLKRNLFPKGEEFDGVEEDSYEEPASNKSKDKSSTSRMILAEPRAYSESQTIVDNLKKRNPVVVNLKRVTADQSKRIIDFLSGALYALGGDIQKLGTGIYLCTPKNVDVEGKMSDDAEEKKSKNKIEDELDF